MSSLPHHLLSLSCLLLLFHNVVLVLAQTGECVPETPNGPLLITADCVDPDWSFHVVDSSTDELLPAPHRRVSGHIATNSSSAQLAFNIYLPSSKEQWAGRFWQLVYPIDSANATDGLITAALDDGAYLVQVQGIHGHRAYAAGAKLSRTLAAEHYGGEPPADRTIFGYLVGGSGGSMQAVGAAENTQGVWHGIVPFIQAVPISYLNNPSVRMMAGLVLRGKKDQIVDAVSPGGSGDPFAGLSSLEASIFHEALALGVPLKAFEVFDLVTDRADVMSLMMGSTQGSDPTYADDFWNAPGYLGTEESELGDLFRATLVKHNTTVARVDGLNITLDSVPDVHSHFGLEFTLFGQSNTTTTKLSGSLDLSTGILTLSSDADAAIEQGSTILIDNRWLLAMHAYYRHQVPTRSGYYGYDTVRAAGYPQRSVEVSVVAAEGTGGDATYSGRIRSKMIAVNNIVDYDAFPWHADWYRSQVQAALGEEAFADMYRLWFNNHADHTTPAGNQTLRIVEGGGLVYEALRALGRWVEYGVEPAATTGYSVQDGQVILAESAVERKGIQPVVTPLVPDPNSTTTVGVGDVVEFEAFVQVPPGGDGGVLATDWNFDGVDTDGNVVFHRVDLPVGDLGSRRLRVGANFTYEEAGTYFPVLRVNTTSSMAYVSNLGRWRVVVD